MRRTRRSLCIALWLCLPACSAKIESKAAAPLKEPAMDSQPSAASPQKAAAPAYPAWKHGDLELQIRDHSQLYYRPQASAAWSTLDLGLPAGAVFAPQTEGDVQVVKTEHGLSLIAAYSKPEANPQRNTELALDCDTRLRGILVREQHVSVSKDLQQVASCTLGPWDELMHITFAASALDNP